MTSQMIGLKVSYLAIKPSMRRLIALRMVVLVVMGRTSIKVMPMGKVKIRTRMEGKVLT